LSSNFDLTVKDNYGNEYVFPSKLIEILSVQSPVGEFIATYKGSEISGSSIIYEYESISLDASTSKAAFDGSSSLSIKNVKWSVLKDGKGSNKTRDQFILSGGGFMPGFEQNIIGMKNNEEKEFSIIFPQAAQRKDLAGKEVHFKVRVISVQKVELPEVNDEFAKTLGRYPEINIMDFLYYSNNVSVISYPDHTNLSYFFLYIRPFLSNFAVMGPSILSCIPKIR